MPAAPDVHDLRSLLPTLLPASYTVIHLEAGTAHADGPPELTVRNRAGGVLHLHVHHPGHYEAAFRWHTAAFAARAAEHHRAGHHPYAAVLCGPPAVSARWRRQLGMFLEPGAWLAWPDRDDPLPVATFLDRRRGLMESACPLELSSVELLHQARTTGPETAQPTLFL